MKGRLNQNCCWPGNFQEAARQIIANTLLLELGMMNMNKSDRSSGRLHDRFDYDVIRCSWKQT